MDDIARRNAKKQATDLAAGTRNVQDAFFPTDEAQAEGVGNVNTAQPNVKSGSPYVNSASKNDPIGKAQRLATDRGGQRED